MSWLKEVFGTEKVIIGLLHLKALPGDPFYEGSMEDVIAQACRKRRRGTLLSAPLSRTVPRKRYTPDSLPWIRTERPRRMPPTGVMSVSYTHLIVAEIGRHLAGNKGIYQERRHLELEKASQPMHKQLLGVFSDFRIFVEQLLSQGHIALQPGIYLIDLPIQDEGINNAEEQFYPYP